MTNEIPEIKKPTSPERDIPGESRIKTASSLDPNFESRLTRNIEQSIRAKHTTKCDWEHLELRVVPAIQAALLEDFKESLAVMPSEHMLATDENFTLTLSFWSRKRMLKKVAIQLKPLFDRAWEDSAQELFDRLPKMLWSLKKVYNSGKSEMLMVAFEWLESVDSAPLKDVLSLVEKAKQSGQTS